MSSKLEFGMLKWQQGVLADKTRFKVVVAGRRCGKTRFSIVQTLIKALECPDPTAAVMSIAPTWGMARSLTWDTLLYLGQPIIRTSNINNGEIRLINGVKICVRGSDNPDSLRGVKLYHVTLDEYQDIKPQTWEYIVRPALSDMRGTALFIGTPKPDAVEFRKIYDLGTGGTDDEWRAWLFKTHDNELIDRREIEAAKRSMSTPAYLQEYEAEWDTTGANILKLEWFDEAPEPQGKEYSTFIAVDPAGFEDVSNPRKKKHLDFCAIAIVRVFDNGHWWVHSIPHGRWDVRETAVRILMAIRNHRPMMVGIEKGSLQRALMPYLSDLMRKNNVFSHIEPLSTSGQGSKANRISYALQGLMEHGRITFNEREDWTELRKEMLAFPSERAHDDLIDACSLIAHMAVTSYGGSDDRYEEPEILDPVVGF